MAKRASFVGPKQTKSRYFGRIMGVVCECYKESETDATGHTSREPKVSVRGGRGVDRDSRRVRPKLRDLGPGGGGERGRKKEGELTKEKRKGELNEEEIEMKRKTKPSCDSRPAMDHHRGMGSIQIRNGQVLGPWEFILHEDTTAGRAPRLIV